MEKIDIKKTELYEIYFSKTRKGKNDKKFTPTEQKIILETIKKTEDVLSKFLSFSLEKPYENLYRVPVIFEKVSKKVFTKKHQEHFALINWPPIGLKWNSIKIKSTTAVISLCPIKDELQSTIAHELIHAFTESFLSENGVNSKNVKYFKEGMTEFLTKILPLI